MMIPWQQQNNRLEQAKIDRVETVKQIISIGLEIPNKRTQALFFLLYLSGCRMCELARKYEYLLEKKGTKKKDLLNGKFKTIYLYNKQRTGKTLPALRGKDIQIIQEQDKPIMLLYLRNEKNRKDHQKIIPIPIYLEEISLIYEAIKDYINSVPQEEELFPFGYQYAYRLLKPYFNPHWFRHIRATHLVTLHGFSETRLRNIMGWSDSRPASSYVKLDWRDLLKGF
jgi:hypothetical protein